MTSKLAPDIFIPAYKTPTDFEINSNSYNKMQLIHICKHYNLTTKGTKDILKNNIKTHISQLHFVSIIHRWWRKKIIRICNELRGPAKFNRRLCINVTDFYTCDDIQDIDFSSFFSYKDDTDGKIYGFDIASFNELYKKTQSNIINPYTRIPIKADVISRFKRLLRIVRASKGYIEPEQTGFVHIPAFITVEQRAYQVFQNIDALGYYTNCSWFLNLTRENLIYFVRHMFDIWNYRANISNQLRYEIYPYGHPFVQNGFLVNMLNYSVITNTEIKELLLDIIVKLSTSGIDENRKYIGASYVLSALTLVSDEAADALPWLYESVV